MKRNAACIVLILIILALAPMVSSPAPAPSGQSQEALKHEVTVTLKLVRVHVVDSRGEPVKDLTKDDFILTDNGKVQTITDFEKHELFTLGDQTEKGGEVKAPPFSEFNRKYFLFFDLNFNTAQGIENARKAALAFMNQRLLPTDEVGVISYSAAKRLILHEPLTTDHQKVKNVVAGISRQSVSGRGEDLERSYWGSSQQKTQTENPFISETDRREQRNSFSPSRTNPRVFQYRALIFSSDMKALAQNLGRIPGHKDILFLSTGIPISAFKNEIDGVVGDMQEYLSKDAFVGSRVRDLFAEMEEILAASDCTVYSLFCEDMDSESSPEFGLMDGNYSGRTTLSGLAAKTGGKYFESLQDIDFILEEIQRSSGSFYVLGYTQAASWDGKFHKLSVKTKRKGCTVQARTGYYNPKPFSELTDLERRLDFLELALEEKSHFLTPLDLAVQAIPWSREGATGLLTLVKIPAAAVQYLSGKEIEITHLVFDDKNDLRLTKGWRQDFTKLPNRDVFFYSLSALPAGRYRSRLVLRNMQTGASAVSSAQAPVEAARVTGLRLSPPLLLVPETKAAYLRGSLLPGQEEGQKMIDLPDLYPCDFKVWAPVLGELEKGTFGLTAVVRSDVPGSEDFALSVTPHLREETTGEVVPVSFSVSQKSPVDRVQASFITFPSEQLGPGKYILQVDVQEEKTGRVSRTLAAFSVK